MHQISEQVEQRKMSSSGEEDEGALLIEQRVNSLLEETRRKLNEDGHNQSEQSN